MKVAIRIPEPGETPLSLSEQQLALFLGIECRNRKPMYAWRTPGFPKPSRPARGKTYELRQMLRGDLR